MHNDKKHTKIESHIVYFFNKYRLNDINHWYNRVSLIQKREIYCNNVKKPNTQTNKTLGKENIYL